MICHTCAPGTQALLGKLRDDTVKRGTTHSLRHCVHLLKRVRIAKTDLDTKTLVRTSLSTLTLYLLFVDGSNQGFEVRLRSEHVRHRDIPARCKIITATGMPCGLVMQARSASSYTTCRPAGTLMPCMRLPPCTRCSHCTVWPPCTSLHTRN